MCIPEISVSRRSKSTNSSIKRTSLFAEDGRVGRLKGSVSAQRQCSKIPHQLNSLGLLSTKVHPVHSEVADHRAACHAWWLPAGGVPAADHDKHFRNSHDSFIYSPSESDAVG
ncbi:hypothetical protein Y032_0270g849 [Ancylostoma ceylanicum]|uniref:Uncharacterized protein n=1 Tax=Ancylostoma ceylanicum TaxID=53326 RepID=A0A016S8I4_9BILA|nr:hypothetical protein Y032_0270g849 [Ancylostoma ceylanicum]